MDYQFLQALKVYLFSYTPLPRMAYMSVETLLSLLRGRKVIFHLVRGSTNLVNPSLYHFKADEVPIQCITAQGSLPSAEAYTSGHRSIVQPSTKSLWFKAKAIGIPTGESKPIYIDGRIYSYRLLDASIGSGRLIWGLSTVDEAQNEISRIMEAEEIGLPVPKPIGIGLYENVFVIDFKDRIELFKMLQSTPRDVLLKRFKESGHSVEAACMFMAQPTDVRVDEILYGFLHPRIHQVLDARDCKDFLRWLGSSCGLNLKLHHDANFVHGTIPKYAGFMTNSHTANHLVDEKGTYMTDYHMAYRSRDKDRKRIECYYLASVMNPLPRAIEAAMKAFRQQRPLVFEMPFEATASPLTSYWESRLFKPESLQEEFTAAFLDGLERGYNRQKIMHVETKIRREILLKAAASKKELFRLLGLPEGMQRGVKHVASLIRTRRFSEEELNTSLKRIEEVKVGNV